MNESRGNSSSSPKPKLILDSFCDLFACRQTRLAARLELTCVFLSQNLVNLALWSPS